MELVPQSLANLLRRAERERTSPQGTVFDLPLSKMWRGTPAGLDLSRRFHGERTANVVGPAAGPHTQLAQNIALSYLAGARILELKTVQILDQLQIPRPCIDAQNVCFNVEWSQELRIAQSTTEYAKAALLVAALRRMGLPEGLGAEDEDYLLDLSLGYDLAGVSSEPITRFVESMLDASKSFERLLGELPPELAAYRDLAPSKRLVSCVTLSTFHGCPAHEIEKIASYLLEHHHLHVVVKLNPTLLGYDALQGLLHDQLGYRELHVKKETFEKDLQWPDALAMIARLRATAARLGLTFGVKLTNTLVVDNHKSFFSEKEMYLSGQPLHVLATQLLAKLRRTLPVIGPNGEPPVVYSFSAGIDQKNFPSAVAADLHPVTTCTDLLRPGGYGRLPKYLDQLGEGMKKSGARDVEGWILRAHGKAEAAMAAVVETIAAEAKRRGATGELDALPGKLREAAARFAREGGEARAALEAQLGDRALVELAHALWVHQAGTENTAVLAASALADPRYKRADNAKTPKKLGSKLALFDCVNCDKCVPVCPNDANFAYEVHPVASEAKTWRLEGGAISEGARVPVKIAEAHQLATFVDACNACGNCDVFCPEDGGPYVMKPHWFGSQAAFEAEHRIDGFYLESTSALVGRIGGERVRLVVDRAARRAVYEASGAKVEVELDGPELSLVSFEQAAPEGAVEVRGDRIVILTALLDGVLSTVNPVSAAFASLPAEPLATSLLARRTAG